MSALERLRKNQVQEFATAIPAIVATDTAKNQSTIAKVATIAVATPQTPKIEDSQLSPEPTPDAIKTAALATGTTWRPEKIFFLRDVIPDASMDESYEAYWRAVRYVGSGHPPGLALQFTIADIRRELK